MVMSVSVVKRDRARQVAATDSGKYDFSIFPPEIEFS